VAKMRYMIRSLKISFIVTILLISVFASFTIINPKSNIVSAVDPLIQYDSLVSLEFDDPTQLDLPIHPLTGIRNVGIKVTYYNTVPDQFRTGIGKILFFGPFKFVFLAPVHLKVEDLPDWADVSVAPSDIIFPAFGEPSELEKLVTVQISVNKQSTAFFPHTISVKATGDSPDRRIKAPPEVSLQVKITPGYIPLISTDPGATIKRTTPGEPVSWDIKVSNNGNGEAIVRAQVDSILPEGWIVSVNPQIIVPSLADGEINEKVMSLTVLPPQNFGYYNINQQFIIKLTSEFSSPGGDSNSTKGEPLYLNLAVQLRGFTVPGFEFILLLSGMLIFIIIGKHKISKKR
jgi:hypothetical protein